MQHPPSVLVVGQTPPPYHGQAIMIQMLVDGPLPGVTLHHVRMNFSSEMNQVGRFSLGKVFHLFALIIRVWIARIRYGSSILYYPPTGPNRIPLYRDILFLIATRWLFRHTVFHFQASGVSQLIHRQSAWVQWLAKRAFLRPDAAIQMSEHMVPDASYFQAKRIYTIPNATHDHASGFMAQKQSDEHHASPVRLLYVGTVCETKGILVVLQACALLKQAGIAFHLNIVGSSQPASFEQSVQSHIDTLQIAQSVTLLGQKTGVEKWNRFAESDIFCFATHYESEGFPVVLVEAMSFGLPVISTCWRGIPSIVDDGINGYLVPKQDPDALAIAIQKIACDPSLMQRMRLSARKKFLSQWTDSRHLDRMAKVFHNLLSS